MPLNLNDPSARVQNILRDSRCKAVLTLETRPSFDDSVKILCLNDLLLQKPTEALRQSVYRKAEDPAYVIYTSGTTGTPKGVVIPHRGVIRLVRNNRFLDFTGINLLCGLSFTFDATVMKVWGVLLNKGTLTLVDTNVITDPMKLEKTIERYGIDVAGITTILFNQTVSIGTKLFRNLKCVLVGGEKLLEQHIAMLREANREIRIINLYGPTENSVVSTTYEIGEEVPEELPIGKPIGNTTAFIFDGDRMCGVGEKGELCLGGDGIALGYLNNQKLTEEKFVENPLIPSTTIYRTGDIASWMPDGNIKFYGRIDDQVKIRGYRIELGEIERQLTTYPDILDVVVQAKDNEGYKYLCAYIIGKGEINTEEIRSYLAQNLPEYMVPNHYIQMEQFPINRQGKIDPIALPKPDFNSVREYIAPRNSMELEVVMALQDILDIESISIYDDFIELGGDSIKAIRIISRLREKGYDITVKEILQGKTIQTISKSVKKINCIEIDQKEITGEIPLTAIQRTFFNSQLEKPNHFNQTILFESNESIDESFIREVFNCVVLHHDMLRATFHNENQEVKKFEKDLNFELKVYNLTDTNKSIIQKRIDEIDRNLQSSINLEDGPIIKAALFHTAEKDFLDVVVHHLVVDGVSWRILAEDINVAYESLKKNKKVVLQKKTSSFQEWSKAIVEYSQSLDLLEEIPYWININSKINLGKLSMCGNGNRGIQKLQKNIIF